MLTFRPHRLLGTLVGSGVVAVLVAGATGLGYRLTAEPASLTTFTAAAVALALLALAACFAYWTYGCWSLRYLLDRNALTIAWAGNSYRVPLKDVTALIPGREVPAFRRRSGIWWPGYRIGSGIVSGATFRNPVLFFATGRNERDVTYVVTPSRGYGISPPDPAGFAQEVHLRARLGAVASEAQETQRWWGWDLPVWQDRAVLVLLGLALLGNAALFAVQALIMPSLPDVVPMHFTAVGMVDRVGAKTDLFGLPAAGLALITGNVLLGAWLHRVERFATYLTLTWAVAVQVLLWGAWLRLLS